MNDGGRGRPAPPGRSNEPFFIIGCVRSGTTLLRDILRTHPRLCCPEETHFFRFAVPFGGSGYRAQVAVDTLQKHRDLDGISETEFKALMARPLTRGGLMRDYLKLYAKKNKPNAERYFDKTPQNVYGLLLLMTEFPRSRFVYLLRNPVNVVASLFTNTVLRERSMVGAANYWRESVSIIEAARPLLGPRLYEVRYEDLTSDPRGTVEKLCAFLGEVPAPITFPFEQVHPERDKYIEALRGKSLTPLRVICEPWASRYGYAIPTAAEREQAAAAVEPAAAKETVRPTGS